MIPSDQCAIDRIQNLYPAISLRCHADLSVSSLGQGFVCISWICVLLKTFMVHGTVVWAFTRSPVWGTIPQDMSAVPGSLLLP